MKRMIGHAFGICLLATTALGVRNVYGDSKPVEELAKKTACAGQGPRCAADLGRMMKTPFFIEFGLRRAKGQVDVRCSRAWVLLGDYGCSVKN